MSRVWSDRDPRGNSRKDSHFCALLSANPVVWALGHFSPVVLCRSRRRKILTVAFGRFGINERLRPRDLLAGRCATLFLAQMYFSILLVGYRFAVTAFTIGPCSHCAKLLRRSILAGLGFSFLNLVSAEKSAIGLRKGSAVPRERRVREPTSTNWPAATSRRLRARSLSIIVGSLSLSNL